MINKSAAHVFHCKEEEAIGRHLSFLFASYKITNAVENALKNAQSAILRLPIDSRIYLTAITPIQSNEATIVPIRDGAVITLLDISESANAENMKQLFFTNASHELKSPLTTIIGYQQMLIEGMLTSKEEKQDALSRSLREALRMKTIITEMLELAQIESQSEIVDAKSIDLDRVITDLLSSMEKDIKDRDIKVTTDLKNLLVYMKAEHAQELVHNLIENAVKYNHPHGHIYIATDGENRTLIVQDNGIGIAKEHQARVFERFYRVDKGRSKEEGGTGLCLAIVKHVAMLYGAKITLKSEESVGSTFIITFK
jgi:two-component system phosphate regulon sensor histidine kinase PhoR